MNTIDLRFRRSILHHQEFFPRFITTRVVGNVPAIGLVPHSPFFRIFCHRRLLVPVAG